MKEAWAPGGLGFAIRFPADMLIVTICICYSVIAPLIIPFGVVYFGLGWLVMRNEVMAFPEILVAFSFSFVLLYVQSIL